MSAAWWVLAIAAAVAWAAWLGFRPLVRRWVEGRLGGYRHRFNHVDPQKPWAAVEPKRVAVIGSGLAGLSAAHVLSERGLGVVVFEKNDYLGGKLGAWSTRLTTGETVPVSHGFHAFFRHYYNLNRFLDRLGLRRSFASVGDYVIMRPGGDALRFGQMDTTPVLNLLSLHRSGFFRWRDILLTPARDYMHLFFRYHPEKTFEQFDHESFHDFANRAHLPDRIRLAFNTFARAFFADEHRMSTAELMKSIHFYYFGHDRGLVYDFPTQDYTASLLEPIRGRLESNGAEFRLGTPVESLSQLPGGWHVNGEAFDHVVLATDVAGVRALAEHVDLGVDVGAIEPGQRYASMRMWIDRDARKDTPAFVITDGVRALDAVAFYHRIETEAADYVRRHGGAVVELHCYAVPDELETDDDIRRCMAEELSRFFPELEGYRVRDQSFYVARNFTAFHVGRYARRPTTRGTKPGLVLAGDWVKLPFPAMLMEGAFSSGLLAANVILAEHGLREEPVDCVPTAGFLPPMRGEGMKAKGREVEVAG
jgi:isorenieratene synthase